ncbi:MAG: DNA-binding protein [Verrucomicrobia bacterium]|nr:DNA-binding protein [Verrucomicrobiota bacterium]
MTLEVVKYDAAVVESVIHTARGQRVIIDADLARLYGVPTKRLNEQVRRNAERFPSDFVFQLEPGEAANVMSQHSHNQHDSCMRSQIATASKRNISSLPYAFTEHGAIMAANVLNSPQAIQMSVFVVRAFVRMRQMLASPSDLARKLAELEEKLTARLDGHEIAITEVLQQIMLLLNPPPEPPEPPRKELGFHVRERRAVYRTRRSTK